MKEVFLYIPKIEDLWFREKCMSDSETMNYNSGYNVNFDGYHFDTGCIDFPKEKWQSWYNEKFKNPNFYYAYICDAINKKFIGNVNFNCDPKTKKASIGIVVYSEYHRQGYMRNSLDQLILIAKEKGIKILTDSVPENRVGAHKIFKEKGFVVVNKSLTKKFDKDEIVLEIEKTL